MHEVPFRPDARINPMRARTLAFSACFTLTCGMLPAGCSSSSTSVIAPTSDKCQVSVANNPSSFGATGGAGSVTISTSRDCTWSIAADAPWVSIVGDHSGQGDGVVAYSVAVNTVPAPRSGSIVVGSQKVQLSQAGAPCRFDLSRSRDAIGPAGGHLAVDVTTMSGCQWDATSDLGWIVVSSGQTGNASGSVGLTVAANSGAVRAGSVKIAGQNFSVTQDAIPAPAPAPAPAPGPGPAPAPTPPPSPTPTPPSKPVQFDGTYRDCPDGVPTCRSRRAAGSSSPTATPTTSTDAAPICRTATARPSRER